MHFVEIVFTQTVVAAVHIAPLDVRLALEFLDEMAVPIQTADERRQACTVATGLRWQLRDVCSRLLHDLAHADATPCQISRQTRARIWRRQR